MFRVIVTEGRGDCQLTENYEYDSPKEALAYIELIEASKIASGEGERYYMQIKGVERFDDVSDEFKPRPKQVQKIVDRIRESQKKTQASMLRDKETLEYETYLKVQERIKNGWTPS